MTTNHGRWQALVGAQGSCLDSREICSYADGTLRGGDLERVAGHLNSCARCSAELSLYRDDFMAADPRPSESSDVSWITSQLEKRMPDMFVETAATRRTPVKPDSVRFSLREFLSMRRLQAMALAAAAFLLLGIYLMVKTAPEIGVSSISSPAREVRSVQLETTYPIGDLERVPPELRWEPLSGASRYEVRILEVDHAEFWKGETAGSTIALPQTVRTKIVPGKRLLWSVAAFDSSGRRMVSSRETSFRVVLGSRPAASFK